MLIAVKTRFFSPIQVLFFFAITILVSCQKEVSLENPGNGGVTGGTAVFSLVVNGNSCSDAQVSGTFQQGAALTGSSKLTVTVNVTKAGDWVYSTGTVNGFVFAGGGAFTTTGQHVIELIAVGTPAAAGNFSFNLTINGATCAVPVTVTTGGSGPITGDIYYKATIDGVAYAQDVTEFNGYLAGSGMGGVDDVSFGGGVNWENPPIPAGKTEIGIGKGVMHHYLSATDAQFKAFFAPGTYTLTPSGDGVTITWTDPSGEYWDTRSGTADQTGSNFKIISATDFYDITNTYYLKVKMEFNCKLYNVNTGAIKTLTNGEAVVYFGKL